MSLPNLTFEKQVVVVAGAAGAIGSSIADAFAARGASMLLLDRDKDGLERLSQRLDQGRHTSVCLDASDQEAVDRAVSAAAAELGGIDVAISAVGMLQRQPIQEVSLADWSYGVDANLTSAYVLAKSAIPHFNDGGSICFISSVVAHSGSKISPVYGATKAGVLGFARSLASELGPLGVRVNCVSPAAIEGTFSGPFTAGMEQEIVDDVPLGRLGTPEDVAGAVLYLSSSWATYVTGESILVTGGSYIG